jgi:hypothetical protein
VLPSGYDDDDDISDDFHDDDCGHGNSNGLYICIIMIIMTVS